MIRIFGLIIIYLLGSSVFSDSYYLVDVQNKASIDKKFIHDIDNVAPPFPQDGNYMIGDIKTISGKNTVYRFLKTYTAEGHGGQSEFHDIIVMEVRRNKILSAWQYTIEWSDSPSIDLYKMKARGLKFTAKMNFDSFQFTGEKGKYPETGDVLVSGKKSFVSYNNKTGFLTGRNITKKAQNSDSEILTLDKDELKEDGKFILFEPDRRVMRSSYKTYYFNKKKFIQQFGSLEKADAMKVTCVHIDKKSEQYIPDDPRSAKPDGGFNIKKIFCNIE